MKDFLSFIHFFNGNFISIAFKLPYKIVLSLQLFNQNFYLCLRLINEFYL